MRTKSGLSLERFIMLYYHHHHGLNARYVCVILIVSIELVGLYPPVAAAAIKPALNINNIPVRFSHLSWCRSILHAHRHQLLGNGTSASVISPKFPSIQLPNPDSPSKFSITPLQACSGRALQQ